MAGDDDLDLEDWRNEKRRAREDWVRRKMEREEGRWKFWSSIGLAFLSAALGAKMGAVIDWLIGHIK